LAYFGILGLRVACSSCAGLFLTGDAWFGSWKDHARLLPGEAVKKRYDEINLVPRQIGAQLALPHNRNGLTQESFDRTREFLGKYVNVLTRTKRAELGYAVDSLYYGIPQYNDYLKTQLAKLTLADVNRVVKQYIRTDRLVVAAVTRNGEDLKRQLSSDDASPMTYNSPKPKEITDEDKLVIKWPLSWKAQDITVRPVGEVFQ